MNENKPLVSIILPTYNRAEIVGNAIESALNQSYKNIEIIIVDDGSKDDTEKVVNDFKENTDKITYIKHEDNKGQAAAENTGVKLSNGQYIAFLDSDTVWLPKKIEKQLNKLVNSPDNVVAVYCGAYNEVCGFLKESKADTIYGNSYEELLAGRVKITTSTLMIKTSCIEECGMWDTDLPSYIDYDLCLRIAQEYEFTSVQSPLLISLNYSGPRVSTDLESKIDGLDCIIGKWGEEMETKLGKGANKRFRNQGLSSIYQTVAMHVVKNGQKYLGIEMYAYHLIYCNKISVKMLALFIITTINNDLANFIKKIWYKIHGKEKKAVLEAVSS